MGGAIEPCAERGVIEPVTFPVAGAGKVRTDAPCMDQQSLRGGPDRRPPVAAKRVGPVGALRGGGAGPITGNEIAQHTRIHETIVRLAPTVPRMPSLSAA